AFLDVKRRLAEHEAHEFKARILGMALDREYAFEGRLQTFGLARVRCDVLLQKRRIGIELSREQIRHGQHTRALGETLADTFFLVKRVAHSRPLNSDSGTIPSTPHCDALGIDLPVQSKMKDRRSPAGRSLRILT